MMKKIGFVLVVLMTLTIWGSKTYAVDNDSLKTAQYLEKLNTIDEDIKKMFPRWTICEKELMVQVSRAFEAAGYDKKKLDMNNIQVIAIPKDVSYVPKPGEPLPPPESYKLLIVSCGDEIMNAREINMYLKALQPILSGEKSFLTKERSDNAKRDYCYKDIPPETQYSQSQSQALINYFQPTDVKHAFTLSLFEQSLKVGSSGFWIKSFIGSDEIGYPFWAGGESKISVRKPVYVNEDPKTRDAIPFLINATIGYDYGIKGNAQNSGNSSSALNWVTKRKLSLFPGGKVMGGIEFSLPYHPNFGISVNAEIPVGKIEKKGIEPSDFYMAENKTAKFVGESDGLENHPITHVTPILRETGQVKFFYNWWPDEKSSENFFRFDFGLSYFEVREVAEVLQWATIKNVAGLKTYKPDELGDWVYLKAAYTNNSSYPFGISLQYSNQILLTDFYITLFPNWLVLEGKYAKHMRGALPFELENFFMISPVIRITI